MSYLYLLEFGEKNALTLLNFIPSSFGTIFSNSF